LILLTACGGECKTAADCAPRTGFEASCLDKECKYAPIPGVCGNNQCEPDVDENKCTCAQDCGPCTGKVAGSTHLGQKCVDNECIEDVVSDQVPVYSSAELSSAGDKFTVDTEFKNPLNLKKDKLYLTVTLSQAGRANVQHRVTSVELSAMTADRSTITLARQDVDKPLWEVGSSFTQGIILDFPTADLEGVLSNMILTLNYDYMTQLAGKLTPRQGTAKNRYNEKLTFVMPGATYACPETCDDGNPGTKDTCGPQTNFFCAHEPLPNACGNFVCDSKENKCTCPQDCGPCSGSAGQYLDFTCKSSQCITELKPEVSIKPNSLFDDRSLGPVQLNNNFKYNNPFNVKTDEFELDFAIYRIDPSVSDVVIETVRILEGQQQLAEVRADQSLSETATTIVLKMPALAQPEEEHAVNLGIWYKFDQGGQEKRGNYQKQLGKVTFISPQ